MTGAANSEDAPRLMTLEEAISNRSEARAGSESLLHDALPFEASLPSPKVTLVVAFADFPVSITWISRNGTVLRKDEIKYSE